MNTADILSQIITQKKHDLTQRKIAKPIEALKKDIRRAPPIRNFCNAILQKAKQKQMAIIAEIKKASPSKGVICSDFQPDKIAKAYESAGASCLSVLTEEAFFQGKDQDLMDAKQSCELPILRKDFIIDSYQIYESRAMGADCILLIAAILQDDAMKKFHDLALFLGMSVLVESHNQTEIYRALSLKDALIGINNRNLHTFATNLDTTYTLLPLIPKDRIIISESGISTGEQIQHLKSQGVQACLIGEAFMRSKNIQTTLSQILQPSKN